MAEKELTETASAAAAPDARQLPLSPRAKVLATVFAVGGAVAAWNVGCGWPYWDGWCCITFGFTAGTWVVELLPGVRTDRRMIAGALVGAALMVLVCLVAVDAVVMIMGGVFRAVAGALFGFVLVVAAVFD
jgi:hypothetical protein